MLWMVYLRDGTYFFCSYAALCESAFFVQFAADFKIVLYIRNSDLKKCNPYRSNR